jgi:hypothetical protein
MNKLFASTTPFAGFTSIVAFSSAQKKLLAECRLEHSPFD